MFTFLMIYLGIGMVFTAVSMWHIGKRFGTFIKACEYYYGYDVDFISFCHKYPNLIEWGSYIFFTLGWLYFILKDNRK